MQTEMRKKNETNLTIMNKSEGLQIIYITGFKIKRGIYEELYAK